MRARNALSNFNPSFGLENSGCLKIQEYDLSMPNKAI